MLESSDYGSSAHSGKWLRAVWAALFGVPDPRTFETIHHIIRKTGHFTGYAILSWLLFSALRATWRSRQAIAARSLAYYWQLRWAVAGVAGAAFAGSLDEFHQSFNPARTSRWQDVVIDSSGAIVLQILLLLAISIRNSRWRQSEV